MSSTDSKTDAENVKNRKGSEAEAKQIKTDVNRLLSADLLFALLVIAAVYLLAEAGFKSVIVGALIFLIPNGVFAWIVFRNITKVNFMIINQSFYRAASMKFMLTAGLFAYSFKMLQPVGAAWIFATYGLLFVVHQVLAAFIVGRNTNRI
ncbi:MAG: ATP synthase subunit I [Pseudomonadales bacterium]|nr:ATP synthase subunit I [Pseudomonadales bacterium]